ncbi:MAG: NUDIX domain-containing protein [Cyanophyceae cyanobacterium]
MTALVALAILYETEAAPVGAPPMNAERRFLLQLRDDTPAIAYPGVWGLFGGHLEPEETPLAGLKRELLEEINYAVASPRPFRTFADKRAVRHIFSAPLTVPVQDLILREGQDLRLLSPGELRCGSAYSVKASQVRKIGAIHQRILIEFMGFLAAEQSRGAMENG